jgi:hypothetical protein
MQLTLVSHFGEKPPKFAAFIHELQQVLSSALGKHFRPYAVKQVHATIIGLEGTAVGAGVHSENLRQLRGEKRYFEFPAMLDFLRRELSEFEVQIGAFLANENYGFLSRGQSPFARSFSMQGKSVVVIGWPRDAHTFPLKLDHLRRALEPFGALRKWAWRAGEVDNDFYFVLGEIADAVSDRERTETERRVRELLASMLPLTLRVSADTLAFAAYSDLRLPLETSHAFGINDAATTPAALTSVYERPRN